MEDTLSVLLEEAANSCELAAAPCFCRPLGEEQRTTPCYSFCLLAVIIYCITYQHVTMLRLETQRWILPTLYLNLRVSELNGDGATLHWNAHDTQCQSDQKLITHQHIRGWIASRVQPFPSFPLSPKWLHYHCVCQGGRKKAKNMNMRLHLSPINMHAWIHISTQCQFSGHLWDGLQR